MIKNNSSEVSDSDFYFGTSTKSIIIQFVLTLSALYSSICVSTGLGDVTWQTEKECSMYVNECGDSFAPSLSLYL